MREPDARIAARAAEQRGAFHRDQARAIGLSRKQVRHRLAIGRWDRLARDVFRIAGTPETWEQLVVASLLEAGPRSCAARRTAAALHELPGYPRDRIEVLHPECRDNRVRLSVLHQTSLLPDDHVVDVDGIACTSLARTLFDLLGSERRARATATVRNALRRPDFSIGELEKVVAVLGTRGRPGTKLARQVLVELGDGYVPTASELEELTRAVLAAAGVELPDEQVEVGGDELVGRVDFLLRDAKLVIEAQSRRWHSSWAAQQSDMARRAELAAAGYRVIEVTWWELVHQPEVFVDRVRRALRA